MEKYWSIFINGYTEYARYLWMEVTNPGWNNYFYWLIMVSGVFFILEMFIPWRRKQPVLRKDFWLDVFYMFFNFFLFSLIVYNAASEVVVNLFNEGIKWITGGVDLQRMNPLQSWPAWAVLLTGFLVRDFIQWWVHRSLHHSKWLWQFHQVHHSVREMGFAAHLRYHWMENVIYRTIEYIPLALLGIGLYDFFVIHIFTLTWGHYNHSNISISGKISDGILGGLLGIAFVNNLADFTVMENSSPIYAVVVFGAFTLAGIFILGPYVKYLFNSPEMHIWHHAYELPNDKAHGINFGITLAIWDYLFQTAHLPNTGRDIKLGFPGIEEFPDDFIHQNLKGL